MNIGILSRGPQLYSTQRLYQEGVQRGHRVHIIDHARCNLLLSSGKARIVYEEWSLGHLDAVIPRIGSSVTLRGAAVISHFELMGVFTVTRAQALLHARDKLRCLQRLVARKVAVPRSAFVAEGEDLEAILRHVGGLPVVVKLLESTHGAGVLLAETLQQLEATVEAFHRLGERVIIQEFIREVKGADIRAFVVAGEVVASMLRQAAPGEFRSNLHRGATAMPVVLTEEEKVLALRSVAAMGLNVAGVDLLRSEQGPLVLEVNASPGLEGIEQTTGIDVAGRIIEFVEQQVPKWKKR